jgi:hypothetical protein
MTKSFAFLTGFIWALAAGGAIAQPLPFEVCTAASGDTGGIRCASSVHKDGKESVEIQIPANSFHIMSVKPLFRRDVSIELKCFYRAADGSDKPATGKDGQACPSGIGESMHIKTIALGLAGPAAGNYILGYRCWTSQFQDPTKNVQSMRIWYGPASDPCGVVEVNHWISGIEIYTYGLPQFP